jgi:hypothetical protein
MGDKTLTPREIAEVVLNIKDLAYKQGYNKGFIEGLSVAVNRVNDYYQASKENYRGSNDLTRPLEEIIEYLETEKRKLNSVPPG